MPVRVDRYFDPKLVKEMSNPLLIVELTRSKKLHLPTKSTPGKGEGFSLRLSLKVKCNENFAVLGQFCAKIIQTGGGGGGFCKHYQTRWLFLKIIWQQVGMTCHRPRD